MKRALVVLSLVAGCQGPDNSGVQVQMHFDRAANFYAAPFPSDDLRKADGTIDVSGFPNPSNIDLISQGLTLLARDARGFGVGSGVFFTLDAAIDSTSLPSLAASTAAGSPVFLVDLDHGGRHPINVRFVTDGGPFGADNLLSLVPQQGIPLHANTRYAAVVLRAVTDAALHKRLGVGTDMLSLVAGTKPAGLGADAFATYQKALTTLAAAGVTVSEIAGLAVFTTDDPTAPLAAMRTAILAGPLPVPAPFVRHEVFDNYCVYQSTVSMPDYQSGTPPYTKTGGDWTYAADGTPNPPTLMLSNLWVTVPRTPMPASGFPTAVMVRTGGGGDRPLVDRGPQLADGDPPITPGTGPALYFAMAGFAGVSVDGPLGGLRNPWMDDEQYLIFNVFNAAALRDNVRESALELTLLPPIISAMSFDTSDCPGAGPTARFDTSKLALLGHSTGSEIATLALAAEPAFRVGLLSGAGGSWIMNVMYKQKPQVVRPLAEVLLDYVSDGRMLTENDPALSLVQWAAEGADDQVYAHQVILSPTAGASPRHVLMMQGIVDNYIRPPIANSESLPLGLDLGGPALDAMSPELTMETHLLDVLPLVGRGQITLPATGNLTVGGVPYTGVVTQHLQDAYEDGHEVVFQTDPPKHQYRCFLQTWLTGVPTVFPDGAADAPCE